MSMGRMGCDSRLMEMNLTPMITMVVVTGNVPQNWFEGNWQQ